MCQGNTGLKRMPSLEKIARDLAMLQNLWLFPSVFWTDLLIKVLMKKKKKFLCILIKLGILTGGWNLCRQSTLFLVAFLLVQLGTKDRAFIWGYLSVEWESLGRLKACVGSQAAKVLFSWVLCLEWRLSSVAAALGFSRVCWWLFLIFFTPVCGDTVGALMRCFSSHPNHL